MGYREKLAGVWNHEKLVAGILSGLLAGFVMGLMIQFIMGITPVIGALYVGNPNLVVGWLAHMFHSVLFAIGFVALVSQEPFREYLENQAGGVIIGLSYGVILWIVAAGFIMPAWMNAVGLPSPGIPNFNPQSLVGHMVFGILLGASYRFSLKRLRS